MQHRALSLPRSASHVIIIGNEKGGSGKTALAMHVASALLKAGQSVGTVDLDGNQQSLTRCLENRRIGRTIGELISKFHRTGMFLPRKGRG